MHTVRLETGVSASGTLGQVVFRGPETLGFQVNRDHTWLCRLEDQGL